MDEGLEENNNKKIIENARDYAQMIQEHIFKEDNILYPMADEALSTAVQESMLDKFKEVEIKFEAEIQRQLSVVEDLKDRQKQ